MNQAKLNRNSESPAEILWTSDLKVNPGFEGGSIFSDDSWVLRDAGGKITVTKRTLSFRAYPPQLRDTAKRIAWCMLNIEVPIGLLERPNAARSRLSVGSAVSHMEAEINPFIQWVEQQGILKLRELNDDLLRKYGEAISASALTREYKGRRLWGPTRFWLYAPYLPPSDRVVQPPWEREGTEEILGAANWSAENRTPPIHPQTMSPLIYWALKIVDDFSTSILVATKEKQKLLAGYRQEAIKGDSTRLKQYLEKFESEYSAIPGFVEPSGLAIGQQYIAVMAGVGRNCLGTQLKRLINLGVPVRRGCPLQTKPCMEINGVVILEYFDYYELDFYRQLLATACLIVIAYLSGMRSEECRGLQRGSCRQINNTDGTHRFEIWARSYKDALDSDGNAIKGGAVREAPWHVIAPVAKAIKIMESLHEQKHLFVKGALQIMARENKDLALDSKDITGQIDKFIRWCNEVSQRANAPELHIPADPDGTITMRRFRRTLAWFIFRQPGGRISLGIQYGHLRGYTSDGYGSRTSTGLRDVFPMEEAFARAEALTAASDRLMQGERVSGPAAGRYIAGIKEFATEYSGKFLTVRQAAQLRRNPALRVYDNGMQPVACCYDANQALCHPDRERKNETTATPDLTRCNSRCPNIARTDTHIRVLRTEIAWEKQQANSKVVPEPLRVRHLQRAESLEAIVLKHEQASLTSQDV